MYTQLDLVDMLRLAAEFIARGVVIPTELRKEIGPELMADLETPENA